MDVSERSKITVQVVPVLSARTWACWARFRSPAFENAPGIVYLESPDEGQTTERPSVVAKISETFDMLRAEALPAGPPRT